MPPKSLKTSLKARANRVADRLAKKISRETFAIKTLVAQGAMASRQLRSVDAVNTLADVEFSIFSQWGEDGIIEWLVQRLSGIPESFVEFGVENYVESNTRFLLVNRNWSGLVMDGSEEHITFIRNDPIFWRHDLLAKRSFITSANIDDLIAEGGLVGDIGLLSVDIDGMDYWVWQSITRVKPWIVVVEYNAVYGTMHPIVTPYDPDFVRTRAHASNLYYGASIRALTHLGQAKGYTLVGSNRAGNNAFFVRNDVAGDLLPRVADTTPRPSRFREARDEAGRLTYARGASRSDLIADCTVLDIVTDRTGPLESFAPLYDAGWL